MSDLDKHSLLFLDTVESLMGEDENKSWTAFRDRMAVLGCDTLLYAYVDTINHELETAPFTYKSTVDDSWFEHYYKEQFHLLDHVLVMRKKGETRPLTLGSEILPPEEYRDKATLEMMSQSGQAGFRSSLNFLLSDPIKRSPDDMFAMTIGTTGSPKDLENALSQHGREINILISLIHTKLSYNIVRNTIKPLTKRERECLAWIAAGLRVDRIADRLGVSNAAVHFHLKNARAKLNAKTLAEATAIAIRLKLFEL